LAHPELLDPDDAVLLIVDMQERLAASMPRDDWTRARDGAIVLARAADELGLPTVVTRQYPKGLGEVDAELATALPEQAVTLDKTCFAAAAAPEVEQALAMTGRRQVVIAGMEAHVCVIQTVTGLNRQDYTPFVVADAVCSRDPAHRDNALARLRGAGVAVTNRESCLFEWVGDARHERFKAVAALVK
jgi:isochorismate hydrolase